MTTELDQALLTGNVDDIDASLEGLELDGDLLFGGEDGEGTQELNNQTAVEPESSDLPAVIDTTTKEPATEPTGDAPEGSQVNGSGDQKDELDADLQNAGVREIDGQFYIPVDPKSAQVMGKNGKHTIPYEVLESARNDASANRDRIQELENQLAQSNSAQKRTELLTKQLEEAGITPDRLPDELLNDPEAIKAMQEEIGGQAGQIIGALIERFSQHKGASNPETSDHAGGEITPEQIVADALEAPENAELNSWADNDPDRWEMALIIDNKLKDSPEFSAMSMKERFTEVQRRVKASFGDPVEASVQQELENKKQQPETKTPEEQANATKAPADQQTQVPNSPTSLGGTTTDTNAAAHEALAAQNPLDLEASLSKMTPQQMEEFLANAAIALD